MVNHAFRHSYLIRDIYSHVRRLIQAAHDDVGIAVESRIGGMK